MKRLNFQVAIPTVEDLTNALEGAHPDAHPEWGRMSAPQMLHHVADFGDLYFGEIRVNALTRCAARLLGPFFPALVDDKKSTGGNASQPANDARD